MLWVFLLLFLIVAESTTQIQWLKLTYFSVVLGDEQSKNRGIRRAELLLKVQRRVCFFALSNFQRPSRSSLVVLLIIFKARGIASSDPSGSIYHYYLSDSLTLWITQKKDRKYSLYPPKFNLIIAAEFFFSWGVTYSQVLGIELWASLGVGIKPISSLTVRYQSFGVYTTFF